MMLWETRQTNMGLTSMGSGMAGLYNAGVGFCLSVCLVWVGFWGANDKGKRHGHMRRYMRCMSVGRVSCYVAAIWR